MGVLVDKGFNCFIFYMSSVDKCCYLFGDLFEEHLVLHSLQIIELFCCLCMFSLLSCSCFHREQFFFKMVEDTRYSINPSNGVRFISGTLGFGEHTLWTTFVFLATTLHACLQHYNKAKIFWLHELKSTFLPYYTDLMTHIHTKLQLPASITLSNDNLRQHLNKFTELPGCKHLFCS